MKIADLMQLGLSHSEATLYLTLLRIGASDVQTLINETGFYKANTYLALERLCDKGIISKVNEGKKRIYQLQKPASLIEFIEKKRSEIDSQEKIARELAQSVTFAKKHVHSKETAVVLRGIAGVKQIYTEIIEEKKDYLVFGSPPESNTIVQEYYWKNLHEKQRVNKIRARMIFHKSLRYWTKGVSRDVMNLRFLGEELESLTETTIYGSKVAFTVWTEKPIVTIIDNEHVAASYRQVFELLWKIAKK